MDVNAFRALVNAPSASGSSSASGGKDGRGGNAGGQSVAKAGEKSSRAAKWAPRGLSKKAAAASSSAGNSSTLYRDRAAERRTGGPAAESENAEAAPESFDSLDYAQSKFLGGDLAHTHLVKGVDFVLLEKMRRSAEAAVEEELERKLEEAISQGKAPSAARVPSSDAQGLGSGASTWASGIVAASLALEAHLKHDIDGPGGKPPPTSAHLNGRFRPGCTIFQYLMDDGWGSNAHAPPLIVLRSVDVSEYESTVIEALSPDLEKIMCRVFGNGKSMRKGASVAAKQRQNNSVSDKALQKPRPLAPSMEKHADVCAVGRSESANDLAAEMDRPAAETAIAASPSLPSTEASDGAAASKAVASAAASAVAATASAAAAAAAVAAANAAAASSTTASLKPQIAPQTTAIKASPVKVEHTACGDDDDGDDIFAGVGDYAAVLAAEEEERLKRKEAEAAAASREALLRASQDASRTQLSMPPIESRQGDQPVISAAMEALNKARANAPAYLQLSDAEIVDAEAVGEWELMDNTETVAAAREREATEAKLAQVQAEMQAAEAALAQRTAANAAYARRTEVSDPLARGGISGFIQEDDADGSYANGGGDAEYTREVIDDEDGEMYMGDGARRAAAPSTLSSSSARPAKSASGPVTASGRSATAFAGLVQQKTLPAAAAPKKDAAEAAAGRGRVPDARKARAEDFSSLGGDRAPAFLSRAGAGAHATAGASERRTREVEWNAGKVAGRGGDDEDDDDDAAGKRRDRSKRSKFDSEVASVLRLVEEKRANKNKD